MASQTLDGATGIGYYNSSCCLPAQRRNGGQNAGASGDPVIYQDNCFIAHFEWRASAAVEPLLALQFFRSMAPVF
jgi:hypothetical protein